VDAPSQVSPDERVVLIGRRKRLCRKGDLESLE